MCGCERWGIRADGAGTIGCWCRSPGKRPGGTHKHLFRFVGVIAPPSPVIPGETPQTFLDFGKRSPDAITQIRNKLIFKPLLASYGSCDPFRQIVD